MNQGVLIVLGLELAETEQSPGIRLVRLDCDRPSQHRHACRIMTQHVLDRAQLSPALLPVRTQPQSRPIARSRLLDPPSLTCGLCEASCVFEALGGG